MYERYWQLNHRPFEDVFDTQYFFASAEHQAVLLKLRYAVENRRAAAVVCGPAGVGKTLLMHSLARQLPEAYAPFAQLAFPQMQAEQLVAYLADRLCGVDERGDVRHSLERIEKHLAENAQRGKHAVVVIDEAHVLVETGALETVRLLTNLHDGGRPLLTVILCGLPRLLPALDRAAELEQRFAVRCLLPRLTDAETQDYVQHRLATAGAAQEIFDGSALRALHELSQGAPRRINRLADLALFVGFAEQRSTICAQNIEAVAAELSAAV